MRGQKGQASILIAVIFQLIFVFFAMVINVGLLVHDKINLQNSTDIAAYYAAMKQAQVLNSMAQLNYQIHQSWKLFVWRLWVLGDAGRNTDYQSGSVKSPSQSDIPATWNGGSNFPVVCVTNPLWQDAITKAGNKSPENLCADTNLQLSMLNPPGLMGAQGVFAGVFQAFINGISTQNEFFAQDFGSTGLANYKMAALFLSSFKIAAAHRRFAIHHLQNYLIQSSTDFNDLSGNSVAATTKLTLNNNLTASNKVNGVDFEFQNGLGGNPFMVPIEVRANIPYLDFAVVGKKTVNASVKQISEKSSQDQGGKLFEEAELFWYNDYYKQATLETAAKFSEEQDENFNNQNAFNSLIGFEKNPWVLAYVKVTATSHPKMLFSPLTSNSAVTLTAESYAMPFGGKMGPWFYDSWPNNAQSSQAGNLLAPTTFFSPRMDGVEASTSVPNYSRYPGDTIGLTSEIARNVGLNQIVKNVPSYADYDFPSAYAMSDPNVDPIVAKFPKAATPPRLRPAEIAAVAPDLFDATYYSAAYDFPGRYPEAYTVSNGQAVFRQFPGYDIGSDLSIAIPGLPQDIQTIFYKGGSSTSITADPWQGRFWVLTAPNHLNTSWSQGDPGQYDATQAAKSVGQTWENPKDPTLPPAGGRAGYSVKLVSKNFLTRGDLPLGGNGTGAGGILNPPQ